MKENNIINEYNKIKVVNLVAKKLNVPIYEVSLILRKKGILRDIDSSELGYILKNENNLDLRELEKLFGFTKTQFSQICSRYNLGNVHKNQNEYTKEQIINQFKNLIENKLKYEINDDFPKNVNDNIFNKNGNYHLLKYAIDHQSENQEFKYFSRVAYLTELAYPGVFKGYQFNGKNKFKYFSKVIYCQELLYMIENKLDIKIDNIPNISKCNNFLKKDFLLQYGLGPNIYGRLFGTKKDMWNYFLSRMGMKEPVRYHTKALRSNLVNDGINTEKCFVKNCEHTNINIHHILPKSDKDKYSFDINSTSNLIPLCPNHHMEIHKINIKPWEEKFINFNRKNMGDENRLLLCKILETFS